MKFHARLVEVTGRALGLPGVASLYDARATVAGPGGRPVAAAGYVVQIRRGRWAWTTLTEAPTLRGHCDSRTEAAEGLHTHLEEQARSKP